MSTSRQWRRLRQVMRRAHRAMWLAKRGPYSDPQPVYVGRFAAGKQPVLRELHAVTMYRADPIFFRCTGITVDGQFVTYDQENPALVHSECAGE